LGLTLLEADLPAPSYTIDTLNFLTRNSKGDEEYYFIIGEDAFLEIDTWKSYENLLSLTHFIVSGRPGYSQDIFRSYTESLGYVLQGQIWVNPSGRREIFFLPTATDDISSSCIRRYIRNKMPLEGLIPDGVIEYINKNSLLGVITNI
jgi:nicotinate-nucleotide adenylyltransferase